MNPVLRQRVRQRHPQQGHVAVGDGRAVAAFALELRLADRNEVFLIRDLAFGVVEHLALEDEHRVVVADGALEQPLGVVRRPRRHDLHAWHMGQPGLERLRMLGAQLQRRAVWPAEYDGTVVLSARHVQHLRRRVQHLVQSEDPEIPGHELDDRPQAHHRGADADAGESQLGDRRVDHAHLSEFLEQAFGHLVGALVDGDFLAHEKDAIVAGHLFAEGGVQCVSVGDYWHLLYVITSLRSEWRRAVNPRQWVRRLSRSSYPPTHPRTAPRAAAPDSGRRSTKRPAPWPSSLRRARAADRPSAPCAAACARGAARSDRASATLRAPTWGDTCRSPRRTWSVP